jgi:hypothetical protein
MRLGFIDRACRLLCLALALGGVSRATLANNGSDPARLVLKDDFEAGRFAPEGGLYYKDNPEQRDGRVTFQSRNVMTGHGAFGQVCLSTAAEAMQRTRRGLGNARGARRL